MKCQFIEFCGAPVQGFGTGCVWRRPEILFSVLTCVRCRFNSVLALVAPLLTPFSSRLPDWLRVGKLQRIFGAFDADEFGNNAGLSPTRDFTVCGGSRHCGIYRRNSCEEVNLTASSLRWASFEKAVFQICALVTGGFPNASSLSPSEERADKFSCVDVRQGKRRRFPIYSQPLFPQSSCFFARNRGIFLPHLIGS